MQTEHDHLSFTDRCGKLCRRQCPEFPQAGYDSGTRQQTFMALLKLQRISVSDQRKRPKFIPADAGARRDNF